MKRRALLLAFVLCAALLLPSSSSASKSPTSDEWVEVRSPHFIVVSNAGKRAARRTAIQLEQIRAVFLNVLTNGRPQTNPVITVLALKNEASLRGLIPQYWSGYHARPAGIFSHRLEQSYIALDLSAPGTNPNSTIYHEYFHALSTPYLPDLPAWLAEGLADFYGDTQVRGSKASVGLPDASSIEELKRATPLPLAMLFQVDHASPYYNLEGKTLLFHAESWAVTDYLMIADHGVHRKLLFEYIADIRRGESPLDAARTEFGDLAKLQTRVLEYMRCWPLDHLRTALPARLADSDLTVRAISASDADVYRGGFLAVQGQADRAIPLLQSAAAAEPGSATAERNLALAFFFADQPEAAVAVATRAVAIEPHDAITRYIRAYCSFRGTMLQGNSEMEGDLRAAIAADPGFAPPHAFLAAYLVAQATRLNDAYEYAQKAVAIDPTNSVYQLTLAKVLGRMGRGAESRTVALRARDYASDASDQRAANLFLGFLEQKPADSHEAQLTSGSRP